MNLHRAISGQTTRLLRVDAGARRLQSRGRVLADGFVDRMRVARPDLQVRTRDLGAEPPPPIDELWIAANTTAAAERTEVQRMELAFSDELVDELRHADLLLLVAPIYNFSVPSPLKAWIDLVCRARLTFKYGPNGPEGLILGLPAIVLMTSGGTEIGGPLDFASAYLRHVLLFIGIEDVTFVAADRLLVGDGAARSEAAALNLRAIADGLHTDRSASRADRIAHA